MSEWLNIESLDIDAQGIAHREDGKVVFVEGALPFEAVTANIHRRKNNWEQGTVSAIARESSQRVKPACPHFGLHAGACGGCKMQHLHPAAQVAVKQRALEDNLWHLGKVKAQSILRPIEGPTWGYRYRARLSVRHVHKKGTVLVGFHERKSRYVADMKVCHVLPPHVSAMLIPLRELIFSMDARETCPQIELACGDEITALVLRHLEPLSRSDRQRLKDFAHRHPTVQWWLQAKGPDSIELLEEAKGSEASLSYKLPEFGLTMPFKPTDFTQVNPYINRVLVSRALRLLETRKTERVIDWFCGLGNFTLPLSTQAKAVLGVEGSPVLVARSKQNYEENKRLVNTGIELCAIDFIARDLFQVSPEQLLGDGPAEKWLLDPPREGAFSLVKALVDLIGQHLHPASGDSTNLGVQPLPSGWTPPKRIVYVSCNPATLARDAGLLVNLGHYNCSFAGVVNMFPHTAHVESIAVFDWMGP